jgi:hypothetical protein
MATINLLRTLTVIVRQIPDRVTVTYAARTADDTYADGVDFDARRGPQMSGDIDGMSRRWATWHLYALDGQTVSPTRLGRITHGSEIWDVAEVVKSYGDLKFDCECVLRI